MKRESICLTLLAIVCAIVIAPSVTRGQSSNNSIQWLSPFNQQSSGKRLGLVIGNSAYQNVQALRNPERDASAVASKLQGLGYDVELAENVDRRHINEAIMSFLDKIEPNTQAVLYYSGHGVELNGANYLLPTDIPSLSSEQERLLRTEGINITDLLLDIESKHALLTLVILDACRDNPFRVAGTYGQTKSLGAAKGLARVEPPTGSFVIFAAGVGEEALDNLGSGDTNPNGLFARKLLTLMDENGLEIRTLVQKLRSEVREAALTTDDHHSQIPSYYDQMFGEFYFRPPSGTPSAVVPVMPLPPAPTKLVNLPPPAPTPVPPLACGVGEQLVDGRCEALACNAGYKRDSSGECHVKTHVALPKPAKPQLHFIPTHIVRPLIPSHMNHTPAPKPRVVAMDRAHQSHKGGCFSFNGARYCE